MIKIYGKNVIKEAIDSNRNIYEVTVSKTFSQKENFFIKQLNEKQIPYKIVDNLTDVGNHQGIIALVDDYKYVELDEVINGNRQYFLILDGIVDPQNLGAIIRTADAAQIDGIIIPKNNAVSLNATVAKVSVGAIEHVKIIQVNSLIRTIEDLKTKNFWIVGTTMDAKKKYTEIDKSTSLAIVIGSEGSGIRRLVLEKCDYLVSIPMNGKINSLNASVSAALLMYELVR